LLLSSFSSEGRNTVRIVRRGGDDGDDGDDGGGDDLPDA